MCARSPIAGPRMPSLRSALPVMTRSLVTRSPSCPDRTAGPRVPTSSPCLPQLRRSTCGRLPRSPPRLFQAVSAAVLATLAAATVSAATSSMVGYLFGLSIATGMSPRSAASTTVLEPPTTKRPGRPPRRGGRHRRHLVARESPQAQLWVLLTALTTVFTIAANVRAVARRCCEQAEPGGYQRPTQLIEYRAGVATDLLVALGAGFPSHDRSWGPWEATGASCCVCQADVSLWHRVRDGTIYRSQFKTIAARSRREVKASLESGQSCGSQDGRDML